MKIIVFTTLLITAGFLHATPQMWIEDNEGRIPLSIDSLEVDITITGDLVETLFTLRFRNKTNRIQEGEFVIPLPDGVTVSRYALEVNGALREAVAVEKHQARNAYESIKRQMIDPGLVEREKDNTYRTRVFPIPANGTKMVRIGYIEQLSIDKQKVFYELPTSYPGSIEHIRYRIHHPDTSLNIFSSELNFHPKSESQLVATAQNKKFIEPLKIEWAAPEEGSLISSSLEDGKVTHHLTFKTPISLTLKKRAKPKHVHIIWDASASRQNHDLSIELELLDSYFQYLQNTQVTLQLLRNRLINAGSYEVKSGQWEKLHKRLNQVFYDGSTNFHQIGADQPEADITLLITDGKNSQYLQTNKKQLTYILHRSNAPHLIQDISSHYETSINLTEKNRAHALQELTHRPYILSSLYHNGEYASIFPEKIIAGKVYSITYQNRHLKTRNIELIYTCSGHQKKTFSVRIKKKELASPSLTKIHWAQTKLRHLEATNVKKTTIIDHCRKYRLVSNFTSLIVLERFEDYLTYNIPPPEPELQEKWRIARAKIKKPRTYDHLTAVKKRRLEQAERQYSWLPPKLIAHYQQADIWLDALAIAFQPKDLDKQSVNQIRDWKNRTSELIKAQPGIKSTPALQTWINQHGTLVKEWYAFKQLTPTKSANQTLAISIRGLVENPKTYRIENPVTLKQAIEHADGLHYLASPLNVSLYRSAHATTYNVASKNFDDIPLVPGDMVVVGSELLNDDFANPFGEIDDTPSVNPVDEPSISSITPQVSSNDVRMALSGGGDSFEGRGEQNSIKVKTRLIKKSPIPPRLKLQDWDNFTKNSKNPETVYEAYQKLLTHHPRKELFYNRAADILLKHGHTELATQVISNLSEPHGKFDLPAMRKQAFYLTSLGLHEQAAQLLEVIIELHGPHSCDLFLLAQNQFQVGEKQNTLSNLSTKPSSYPQAVDVAIASAGIAPHSGGAIYSADIRCVFLSTHSSQTLNFHIEEPIGHRTLKHAPSAQGGIFYNGDLLQEYVIRNAIPGDYTIKCHSSKPVCVHAIIFKNWGSEQQTVSYHTFNLNDENIILHKTTVDFP